MLEDLQEAFTLNFKYSPVMELENSSVASSIEQVLHLGALHGRLPGGSCDIEVRVTRTRRSFRFLRQWKAISGGSRNALCKFS